MARNKITVEWNADGTGLVFTGSHRQPTLAEIHNYCIDNHLPVRHCGDRCRLRCGTALRRKRG
nr:MAG TPA: Proteasome/cyclosome repeat [Caudoviricetes sp.]